jgi:hypothetical protein
LPSFVDGLEYPSTGGDIHAALVADESANRIVRQRPADGQPGLSAIAAAKDPSVECADIDALFLIHGQHADKILHQAFVVAQPLAQTRPSTRPLLVTMKTFPGRAGIEGAIVGTRQRVHENFVQTGGHDFPLVLRRVQQINPKPRRPFPRRGPSDPSSKL